MERTMSVEDKIRRAEEIYSRRRESESKITNARVRVDNTKSFSNKNVNKRLKKMIIQIIVCLAIYLIFYYIINNNYIFSNDFKSKCEEILSYDISFSEIYINITEKFNKMQEKYKETNNSLNEENTIETEQNTEQEIQSNSIEANEEQKREQSVEEQVEEETITDTSENIGGAIEEVSNLEETENLSEEEQMKKDAEYIKEKISFIKPLEGVITSNYGLRNPTVSTVSKYHTGIDIGANEGTPIRAATDGTVIVASSQGAYGNHLKIQVENVQIIYAHCSTLEVKEGDKITQGQLIAKVGSTGNSTGPHLHFEIRLEDKYINPKLILDF